MQAHLVQLWTNKCWCKCVALLECYNTCKNKQMLLLLYLFSYKSKASNITYNFYRYSHQLIHSKNSSLKLLKSFNLQKKKVLSLFNNPLYFWKQQKWKIYWKLFNKKKLNKNTSFLFTEKAPTSVGYFWDV